MTLVMPSVGHGSREIVMVAPPSLFVPRLLESKGFAGYEPDALACFLAAISVAKPGCVLDVGANVGVYSILARAVTDREVIAFEPTPLLAEVARQTGERNGLAHEVQVVALGAEEGSATLFLSAQTDSSNSLAEGFRNAKGTLEVPVRTIDTLCDEGMTVPAVIKIDTETTEPAVLKGARRTLEMHRPWLLVEILAGRTEAALTEVIEPFGYFWYRIESKTPYTRREVLEGDNSQMMWLFAPHEVGDDFWAELDRWQALIEACPVVEVP